MIQHRRPCRPSHQPRRPFAIAVAWKTLSFRPVPSGTPPNPRPTAVRRRRKVKGGRIGLKDSFNGPLMRVNVSTRKRAHLTHASLLQGKAPSDAQNGRRGRTRPRTTPYTHQAGTCQDPHTWNILRTIHQVQALPENTLFHSTHGRRYWQDGARLEQILSFGASFQKRSAGLADFALTRENSDVTQCAHNQTYGVDRKETSQ